MKRSKKYIAAKSMIDQSKLYTAKEALDVLKNISTSKFPGSVEVEIQLNLNQKQKSESIRGTVQFPNQFGKEIKVLALVDPANIKSAKTATISGGEELIPKIEKGEIDFDVVVATPAIMPKIARLGKTLGKKGLMPNPKNGTVTTDLEKTITKFKSGQKSYKLQQESKINVVIGKTDMESSKLVENFQALLDSVTDVTKKFGTSVVKSVRIKPTMGPSLQISTLN